jgi:hypothetical protein
VTFTVLAIQPGNLFKNKPPKAVRVAVIEFTEPIPNRKAIQWREAIADMFQESYSAVEVWCDEPGVPNLKKHTYLNVVYP